MQDLQAFAVVYRPARQLREPSLNSGNQLGFRASVKHAVACAICIDFFTAARGLHRERARHTGLGAFNEPIAFFHGEEITDHHNVGITHAGEHAHAAIFQL